MNRIILALDTPDRHRGLQLLSTLDGFVAHVKIGPALFLREGPQLVRELVSRGYKIFLDLKLHDIPNTVAMGVRAAQEIGAWMLSVHLSGGREMLERAASEAGKAPILAGITVLTSIDEAERAEIGRQTPLDTEVKTLAGLAARTGVRAIVASPRDIETLRNAYGKSLLFIAPGIRPESANPDDQRRTMPPKEAVRAGADYLVIGRPILNSPNPKATLLAIAASMEEAPAT